MTEQMPIAECLRVDAENLAALIRTIDEIRTEGPPETQRGWEVMLRALRQSRRLMLDGALTILAYERMMRAHGIPIEHVSDEDMAKVPEGARRVADFSQIPEV